MNRRGFIQSAAAGAALPSLSSVVDHVANEDSWSMRSAWYFHNDYGRTVLYESGAVEYHFRYSDYDTWKRASLVNSNVVGSEVEFPVKIPHADLWRLELDPPFYHTNFRNRDEDISIAVQTDQHGRGHQATMVRDYPPSDGSDVVEFEDRDIEKLVMKLDDNINRLV